ncbi:MAG TPA: CHRD domain-containing protein [Gemmatimonadaceae bacterium]|jgi:hypothetical protein
MKVRVALTALMTLAALGCDGESDGIVGGGNAPLRFDATLTGDAERPDPVVTSATGTADFTVTTGTSSVYDPNSTDVTLVTYSVSVSGLSGAATMAHIHGPADEAVATGVIVPLTVTSTETSGVIISGSFSSTGNATVSMDSLLTLLQNGNSYVNVHTDVNQPGEIRGQIRPR